MTIWTAATIMSTDHADASPSEDWLVIFDNDGVLVDTEPIANGICAEVLTEMGFTCDRQYSYDQFLGTTLTFVRAHVEERLGRSLDSAFEAEYHRRLRAQLAGGVPPVPGVVAALASIAGRRCVASSGEHQRIEMTLTGAGLWPLFVGHVYSAEDVAHGKPAPDLFLHAANIEDAEPVRCVVIEDSPAGVAAARSAGMTCVGYAGLTPAERLTGADAVIDDMSQLPRVLASLIAARA